MPGIRPLQGVVHESAIRAQPAASPMHRPPRVVNSRPEAAGQVRMADGEGVACHRPVRHQHVHKAVCGEGEVGVQGIRGPAVPHHRCAAGGHRGHGQGRSRLQWPRLRTVLATDGDGGQN
jgi:hypothetical protein